MTRERFNWELDAEAITVRIRWFGLAVGYVLVNFIGRDTNRWELNAILALGAVYAVVDTWWSWRGQVFLSDWPLVISSMEAVFIGLLCHFDTGLESPFRFYYFLSLLVCAVRYSPWITYTTLALHAVSFGTLAATHHADGQDDLTTLFLMLVLLGWVTWAGTSLSNLLKAASRRLADLNEELKQNQLQLEERIAERTRELQQSQALVIQQEKQAAFGLLAAGIAHEVGNPLAAISSLVQMLNRRNHDDYTRQRLQMVDDQMSRIQRILRELVDFGRPTTTVEALADIHEAVSAAINVSKYYKRTKNRRIVTNFAYGVPKCRIVRDQLVQVFLNLILNALDATAEGGVIEIRTELRDGMLAVIITDDGHGISTSDQEHIFQPYFTTKPTGTGLGLFVCRSIIEHMSGVRLELTESSPQGTTFTVLVDTAGATPQTAESPRIVEAIAPAN